MKDFFQYRESLTEARKKLEWKPYTKYKGSSCYLIDPKNNEHLNSVGVKSKNQLKGRKTIGDFGVDTEGLYLDYSIYLNQTPNGTIIHTPESSGSETPYVFLEGFKVSKSNAQQLIDWFLQDTSWAKALGY